MGYGSYSARDWSRLKDSKKLSNTKTVKEVFTQEECNPKFNPRFIGKRECFDSKDHPHSTPIVVGIDVTGSMGYLAVKVATEALNDFIMKLYSTNIIEDPALMCAAYGDYTDRAPLQVTQFESDIRIVEQLLEIYFENHGCGQVVPTLLWEFLSRHTNIDAINKRHEKGYLFTIGDCATIRSDNVAGTISKYIGDAVPGATVESLLKEVQQKFHVYHIMIGSEGNKNILSGHKIVIDKNSIDLLPEILLGTIQLQCGKTLDEVIGQWDSIDKPVLRSALSQLRLTDTGRAITL
jgi:hypothetical protein